MTLKLIKTNISKQIIKFKPGTSPASFEISVVNNGDKFASFQIEVLAAGADANMGGDWYNISPGVSAKTPPGDSISFNVTITDTPVAGFVGKMNLTVRIFSLELREEDRQLLRLIVEPGIGSIPVQVELILREFQALPEELIEIPIRVFNPTQLVANVLLQLNGVNPKWLLEAGERRLSVPAGAKVETIMLCQLPVTEETLSQEYPFTVTASHPNGPPSNTQGVIKILPKGYIEFKCIPPQRQIPATRSWLPQWKTNSANYEMEFYNASNLIQEVSVNVTEDSNQPNCFLEFTPPVENLYPGETKQLRLLVSKRRPWFWIGSKLIFEAKAQVSDQRLEVRNQTPTFKLNILPVLPMWLQLVSTALLLYLAWWVSWLNPRSPFFGHKQPVSSLQFNGLGDMAVSGSHEQKMIRWKISGFTNPLINQQNGYVATAKAVKKAVRVVRYKPVDNDVVAAGLENGQIQLWDVIGSADAPNATLTMDKADRVFDLKFTPDSQYLFSGHGSGLVLQWDVNRILANSITSQINNQINNQSRPSVVKRFNFTVASLALVGETQETLLIGGRYNQLRMWNWKQNKLRQLPYNPGGGQEDYIVSLASTQYKPNLMASADNKGQITLWNMEPCLNTKGNCQVLEQWSDGHGGKAVRSVSLSNDGCYLASGGDDNRVMLWSLANDGRRISSRGEEVITATKKFNSVDIKVVKDKVMVIGGNDDSEVRFIQRPRKKC
jgi:WD40 repeat protein